MSSPPDPSRTGEHPSHRPTPDADQPTGNPSSPGQVSAFDAFVQAGREYRARAVQKRTPSPVDADPNPDAIAVMPPRRRPDARFLARRGGRPKSLQTLEYQIHSSCRMLQEAADVPPEDHRPPGEYAWHHIDRDHADRFRQLVHTRYRNVGTQNVYISVVREVLRECYRADLISAARLEDLTAALPTKAAMTTSRGRRLLTDELEALLRACLTHGPRNSGVRDAAIIAVFATTGIRCSDLIALDLMDWNPDQRSLYLVLTKNGHPHTVYLPAGAVDYLDEWLTRRGIRPGPLFTQVIGGPLVRMTYATVRSMLRTRADQADVKRFGSHDFRRTVATTLLRTHDSGIVSRILGHRDVASTAVYDLTGPEECRDAVETLPMPHHPSTPPDESGTEGGREKPQDAA